MTAVAVSGIGAFTPVGTNTPTTMAALLNNVQLFDSLGGLGPTGQPMTVASTPLGRGIDGTSRLSRMAFHAITECVMAAPRSRLLPVVICAPTVEESDVEAASLLEAIFADRALPLDPTASAVVPRGREGLPEAFQMARELIHTRRVPACLLVAVDSLLIRRRLLRLKRSGQLFDPDDNSNGFIPGEGAIALLLEPPRRGETAPLVAGLGVAHEPPGYANDTLITGSAWSSALQRAMADGQIESSIPTCAAIDATSTRIGEELAFAKTRPPFDKANELQVFYPSICVGEAGVTTSLLGVAMLAFFMSKKVVVGPGLAMVTGSAPTRTAFAVTVSSAQKGARGG